MGIGRLLCLSLIRPLVLQQVEKGRELLCLIRLLLGRFITQLERGGVRIQHRPNKMGR